MDGQPRLDVFCRVQWNLGRPTPSTRRFPRDRVGSMAWRLTRVHVSFHTGRVSFAANRAWPIDVRVELQQKQHAVIGDVLDALAHLEDLAENKLERSRLGASRVASMTTIRR